jgi:hypothetical protein
MPCTLLAISPHANGGVQARTMASSWGFACAKSMAAFFLKAAFAGACDE